MEQTSLERLASLADELGPALVPPRTDELLESIAETARSLFGAAACSIALLVDEKRRGAAARLPGGGRPRGRERARYDRSGFQGIAGFVLRCGQRS